MAAKSCMVCGRPSVRGGNRCMRHQKRRPHYDGDWRRISRERRSLYPVCENPGCTNRSEETDHVIGRSLAGGVMALCRRCHRFKTAHGRLPDMTTPPPTS